jgi:hypothetical protein
VNSDPDLDAVADPVSFYFLFLWASVGVPQTQRNSDPEEKKRRREKSAREIVTKYSHDWYKITPNCTVNGIFLCKVLSKDLQKNQASERKKYFLNCKSFGYIFFPL